MTRPEDMSETEYFGEGGTNDHLDEIHEDVDAIEEIRAEVYAAQRKAFMYGSTLLNERTVL